MRQLAAWRNDFADSFSLQWISQLVQRRVLAYLVVSSLFMFIMVTMRPPQPKPEPKKGNGVAQNVDDEGEELDKETLDTDEVDPQRPEDEATDSIEPAPEDASTDRPTEAQWRTLGSMVFNNSDPTSGDKLLITFSNRGAGIERIEMIERVPSGKFRYRRVDTRSGYLGHIAGSMPSDAEGCRVNVVAPGTPADIAGLEVGDVIIAAGDRAIASPQDFQAWREKTTPGQSITVEVQRGGATLPIKVVLTEHPLDLIRLARWGGPDQVKGNISRSSCMLTLARLNDAKLKVGQTELKGIPSLFDGLWEMKAIDDAENPGVEFRFPLSAAEANRVSKGSGQLEIVRRYTVPAAGSGYDIDLKTDIVNASDSIQEIAYRLEGPNGLTLEGWWYSSKISPNWTGGAGARDIVFNTTSDFHQLRGLPAMVKHARQDEEDPNEILFAGEGDSQLRYIGVDGQYFTATYIPTEGATTAAFDRASTHLLSDVEVLDRHQTNAANSSFFVDSVSHEIPPGESFSDSVRLFAGPKKPEMLEERGLSRLIEYGLFGGVSKLLSGFLHLIYKVLGNYGLAIILLTVCVRGMMFPLSRKAAQNAQKMQELAPEFKKIAEKYKDDMEKRLKAQQELQKKHGFNPLSGCLPMFIQLPIFIGLYRSLSCDIELRQAAFIPGVQWCSNLAAPDMFLNWASWMPEYFSGRGTGWFGPYFNILPIIVMVLFMAQQKMFMPPPTDEQQEITQKVMFGMTFFMGIFFFKVAAGLCVYFITSSLWGMGERILVKKTIGPPKLVGASDGGGDTAGPSPDPPPPGSLKSAPKQKNRPKKPPKKR